MARLIRQNDPDFWIAQIFAAKSVLNGGVVRRNRHWIDAEIGRERFAAEVRSRGFHLLETADQLIVVCHRGSVQMHF